MKKIKYFLLFFIALGQTAVVQGKVMVLLSTEHPLYRQAAVILSNSLSETATEVSLLPAVDGEAAAMLAGIGKESPAIIVAIGPRAATEAVKAFPGTPIICMMVIDPERLGLIGRKNVYGVSWFPAPKALARTIRAVMPNLHKIGMVSSAPSKSASALAAELKAEDITLVTANISNDKEVSSAVKSLQPKVEALWLNPDPVLSNKSALTTLEMSAVQNKLPLFLPFLISEDGLAMVGLSATPSSIAPVAASLAHVLLKQGTPPASQVYSDAVHLEINLTRARLLNVDIPPNVVQKADKVYER
jgi:ABC-type uncharacterized transport system substrate-binding protein